MIKTKKFQKKKEDFTCENCGKMIKGTGYTDHCPNCLYSKHADINPGDRQADCQGLMKPISAEVKGKGYIIYYQCLECGYKFRVKSTSDDNFEKILELTDKPIEK